MIITYILLKIYKKSETKENYKNYRKTKNVQNKNVLQAHVDLI